MQFKVVVLFSLLAFGLALPTPNAEPKIQKRAILRPQNYSEFQVSDGVAGNALEEALAKFPVRQTPKPILLICHVFANSHLDRYVQSGSR